MAGVSLELGGTVNERACALNHACVKGFAMPRISARLQVFANLLLPNQPVWDFCCDHGYLGLWAGFTGNYPEVHFVDQVPEIILKLKKDITDERYPLSSETQFFFWPLAGEKIPQVVTGNAVIAGVGAFPLMEILEGLQQCGHLRANRLILSPHTSQEKLQSAIHPDSGVFLQDFRLEQQLFIEERGRMRHIWVFDRTLSTE